MHLPVHRSVRHFPQPACHALESLSRTAAVKLRWPMSIYRRGAVFWWRRRLTLPLRQSINAAEEPFLVPPAARSIMLRISLKTADRCEARRRALALDMELEMVAVKLSKGANPPDAKQLASIYQEALRFKIEQIERIQIRPPFDDHLHAASNKAYALLFGAIARSGTFPEIGTPNADRLLQDPDLSSTEQEVLNEILQVHAPSSSTEALEALASTSRQAIGEDEASAKPALGYPIIAPRFISNYLANAGLPETPENRRIALALAASAYGDACNQAHSRLQKQIADRRSSVMPTLLANLVFKNQVVTQTPEQFTSLDKIDGLPNARHQNADDSTLSASSPSTLAISPHPDELIDLTMSQLCAQAVGEMTASGAWRDSAQRNAKVIADIFIAVNGDLRMSEINRTHLVALNNRLKAMPTIWGKCREDREGGIAAVFRRGDELAAQWAANPDRAKQEKLPKVGLAAATHNRHINTLGQLFKYVADLEDSDGNKTHVHPRVSFSNLTVTDKRRKNKRKPIPQDEELRKLLSGPLFSGCKGQDDRFTPGPYVIHDGGYWVPLMLVVYGARSNELCQMPLMDVFEDAPIPYFFIREDTGRKLKTESSTRWLPIAPKLIELNFLDYIRELKERGEYWLFPEFNQTRMPPRKAFSDRIFSKLLESHFPEGTSGLFEEKDIDTQSMRKVVTTCLRQGRPKIDLGIRQYFIGHSRSTTIEEVYEDDPSLEELLPCVKKTQKLIAHVTAFPMRLRDSEP